MPTFKDASSVWDTIEQMRLANIPAAENRTKINSLFNGNPPWTEDERQQNRIFTNVNFLEGTRIAHHARQQLDNAFLSPSRFFTVRLETGPRWARDGWSEILTENINRILKRSEEWGDLISSTNAQTVLHGVGPVYWPQKMNPLPQELGIEDVLVPARTLVSMRNLEFFAIYREWNYAWLYDLTHGAQVDPGWNMGLVKRLLRGLEEAPLQSVVQGNRWLMPEKLEEDLKENSGWYHNSTAPTLYAWDFFYREETRDGAIKWQRKIVLDYQQIQPEELKVALDTDADAKNQFLYDSTKKAVGQEAGTWQEIIHWQFGNVSNVAPFRYGSVRSLGFLLYAVCQLQNRLRCRFSDSLFESLLQYFWNVSEDDRERIEKVDLMHMGIIPQGLSFVTRNERMEVNEQLALIGFQQNRQLMDESSASYLPDGAGGNRRQGLTPATATEELIRMNTSAALTSAMLNQAYKKVVHLYREVCRRFTLEQSQNPMRLELIGRLIGAGIPQDALPGIMNVQAWEIQPEKILGGGNKSMQVLQADRLMAVRPMLDPAGQRKTVRKYVLANSDAETADELVPVSGPEPTDSTHFANLAIGTLMDGLPVMPPRDTNLAEYIDVMLRLMGQVVEQIQGLAQSPGTEQIQADKISGFNNAVNHVGALIEQMGQDEQLREQAKQAQEGLEALVQEVQPIAQALMKRMQEENQGGLKPEARAQVEAILAKAQANLQAKEADHRMKMEHKDAQFASEMERREAQARFDLVEQAERLKAELASEAVKTQAEVARENLKKNGSEE